MSRSFFFFFFPNIPPKYFELSYPDFLQLEEQIQISIQNSCDYAGNVIANADQEIRRTRSILAAIDDLENELTKIAHIRDIVKSFRARIESYDNRLNHAMRRRM